MSERKDQGLSTWWHEHGRRIIADESHTCQAMADTFRLMGQSLGHRRVSTTHEYYDHFTSGEAAEAGVRRIYGENTILVARGRRRVTAADTASRGGASVQSSDDREKARQMLMVCAALRASPDRDRRCLPGWDR